MKEFSTELYMFYKKENMEVLRYKLSIQKLRSIGNKP